MRNLLVFASILTSAVACAAPSQYSADGFSGRVVDQATKVPIAGVAVVAQWEIDGGLEGAAFDLIHVEEAVTDEKGTYHVAGWGPINAPAEGFLDTGDPALIFFKPGYRVKSVSNLGPFAPGQRQNWSVRNSAWHGRTVELQAYESRGDLPPGFSATIYLYGLSPRSGKCWWKSAPKFVAAVDSEVKLLGGPGQTYAIPRLLTRQQCAPFNDFLRKAGEDK